MKTLGFWLKREDEINHIVLLLFFLTPYEGFFDGCKTLKTLNSEDILIAHRFFRSHG